jgi:hypothetical protein
MYILQTTFTEALAAAGRKKLRQQIKKTRNTLGQFDLI